MSNQALREVLRAKLKQGGIVLAVGGAGGPLFPLHPPVLDEVLDQLIDALLDATAVPTPIDDEPTERYPAHVAEAMPRLSKVIIAWDQLQQ